jgi:hypothetical protein
MTTQQSKITFKTVFEKELEIIKQQRENRKDTNLVEKAPDTLIGLAISGGGIRSASFALGVLQSLDKNNKLRSVDYLSTVSGGGYIGASLTWFNYLNKKKYSSWKFPFAPGPGTRNSTGISEEIPLDFLRQHGDYLLPNGISSLALFSVVLRNMLLSISVYLALIVSIIFRVMDQCHSFRLYSKHADSYATIWFYNIFVCLDDITFKNKYLCSRA